MTLKLKTLNTIDVIKIDALNKKAKRKSSFKDDPFFEIGMWIFILIISLILITQIIK